MKSLVVIFLLGLLVFQVEAQEIKQYRTRNGTIGVSIYVADTLLVIGSNELTVVLDLETSDLLIKLDPASFRTGVDSLDSKLKTSILSPITFKGAIDSPLPLNLYENSLQKFEANGYLTINGIEQHVVLETTIQHWNEGPDAACIIYVHYDIKLSDFELEEKLIGFANDGCIEIMQLILNQR